MNYKQVLAEIKKHTWWSEESPGTIQKILYPLYSFVEQSRYFHPKFCTISIFIFKDDFFYEESPAEEKYQIYQYIYHKSQKDPHYLERKGKVAQTITKGAIQIAKRFLRLRKKLTNHMLWQSYDSLMQTYLDACRYFVAWESVDPFTDYHLDNLVAKEFPELNKKERQELILTFSTPLILSFVEKERILQLEIALELQTRPQNHTKENIKKKLTTLTQKYFFTQTNYKNVVVLSEKDFLAHIHQVCQLKTKEEIEQELIGLKNKVKNLKRAKEVLGQKYPLSSSLRLHFQLVETFGRLIDERKEKMLLFTYYLGEYIKEIHQRCRLSLQEMNNYLVSEIKPLLLDNKKVDRKTLQERQKISAFVITKKGNHAIAHHYYGIEAKKILQTIMNTFKTKGIRGNVACAPIKKFQGKVQVVLDIQKQKFKKGNVLVTTMTRPEFMPIMRKASAIITDEGGITCHAAIVARELGIPCIIGTKIATKVLKDGDFIELDLEKGVGRKIK